MINVVIVIPKGQYSMVNIQGTHLVFSWVNQVVEQQTGQPRFQVQQVGAEKPVVQSDGNCVVIPERTIDQVEKADLIIIPAVHGNLDVVIRENKELIAWLIKQYKRGVEIASLCVGAFLLAEAGLLNGKQCSTHWAHAQEFRNKYPKAILNDDKIITDCDGIYTSGGAFAFTNLLLYLIEKYTNKEMAILASKAFMIDIERGSQSPFIIFTGQKSHGDKVVLTAQEYLEKHFSEKITVDELADQLAVGRRTFERKFKKATDNSVVEYLQRVRVEASKRELERGRKTVNEVMFEVGYSDSKAFRDVFKKYAGLTPAEYLKKFN